MSGSMSFDSYYWADVDFADQALEAARAELAEPPADS